MRQQRTVAPSHAPSSHPPHRARRRHRPGLPPLFCCPQCSACWAFSATAALESQRLIQGGAALDLSEQQLLDCVGAATGYTSQGCSGGYPADAFNLAYARNQTLESLYPYTGVAAACNTALLASTTAAQVIKTATSPGYTTVTAKSASALKAAVAARPVVTYWAATSAMQTYSSGVLPATACAPNATLNHNMVVVGYNATAGWWQLKNSWGATWGERCAGV